MNILSFQDIQSIIQPISQPSKSFQISFAELEKWIALESDSLGNDTNTLELMPDFQRNHVWTESQQVSFVENVLRGIVDASGLTVRFNSPSWSYDKADYSDLDDTLVCVDGLQRITAVRKFMAGEIMAFGLSVHQFPSAYLRKFHLTISIYQLQTLKEVLQLYIDINIGGTPHTTAEIEKVQQMLEDLS